MSTLGHRCAGGSVVLTGRMGLTNKVRRDGCVELGTECFSRCGAMPYRPVWQVIRQPARMAAVAARWHGCVTRPMGAE